MNLSPSQAQVTRMRVGKSVFAQLMDHLLPWKSFGRIVERYGGDHRVRDFSCANQLCCMDFAQLTSRESLRAHLRMKRSARSLRITACDPSAEPSTETG